MRAKERMPSDPNLTEATPNKSDEPRSAQRLPADLENHVASTTTSENHARQPAATSPPVRKDTTSSTSTTTTVATLATLSSNETPATPYSLDASPTFATQAVFSAKDGSNIVSQRRANRRRTGPLTAVQRERAHIIRKMGACGDCRRRRVACHPNHHNMTWEEAARKFKSSSHEPPIQGLAPVTGPRLGSKPVFTQDPQEMDIDTSPTQQPVQTTFGDGRIRTPLPSGPRPEKPASLPSLLPGLENFRSDLQGSADRILSNPFRSRYANVSVLLVRWQDDEDLGARTAIQDLAKVFSENYHYTVQIKSIPTPSDGCKSPWLWLSRAVNDFVADQNHRDILKILYYSGHSYLDGDRDTVLASSEHADPASVIRWSGIQQVFENARADALLIMDCAYYPSYKTVRHQGMLELIAASAGEDHVERLGRSAFTRALTDLLRTRVAQQYKEPFCTAELHSKLLSLYPEMIQGQNLEKEIIVRSPTPLIMQLSGVRTLPSILLAPLRKSEPPGSPGRGSHINITFHLADDAFNVDRWAEWLRLMPEGIMEAKVDGPYRNTFR